MAEYKHSMALKESDMLRHEINNQLEIMMANTELLEHGCKDEKERRRISQIQVAIERLKVLLRDYENRTGKV